jgi:hypothetical protein
MKFRFEHMHKFTEKEYTAINTIFSFSTRHFRSAMFGIVGFICLFWSYTFILGLVILALFALKIFTPRVLRFGAREEFRTRKFLQIPLTYSVSNSILRIKGDGIDYKSSWNNLAAWRENAGWLKLMPYGIDPLYFPIADLKRLDVYDSVMELAKRHGVEYGIKRPLAR